MKYQYRNTDTNGTEILSRPFGVIASTTDVKKLIKAIIKIIRDVIVIS